jgi:hypothetical protein
MKQLINGSVVRRSKRRVFRRLWSDTSAQGYTEYVLLTAVMVAVASWLYFPDNGMMMGMRHTYNKTTFIVGWPGP